MSNKKNQINSSQLLLQASTLHQAGKLLEAKAIYENFQELNPRSFQVLHLLGTVEAQLGNLDKGVDFLTQAIEIDPNYPESYSNLGNAQLELKQFTQAVISYKKAIKLKPGSANELCNLGISLHHLKEYEEAIKNFKLALSVNPEYANAYLNLGLSLSQKGQLDEAIESYKKAIKLQPERVEAYFNLGVAENNKNQYQNAILNFDKSIELNPNFTSAFICKGNALNALGFRDESIACYRESIATDPNSEVSYYNVGIALTTQNLLDDALMYLNKAIEINPSFAAAHTAIGYVNISLNRYELALESYDRAIELDQENSDTFLNRGNALCELRRFEESLASYDRAIELKIDFAQAYSNRGHLLLSKLHQPALALIFLEVAIGLKPDFVEAIINKAHALYQLKEYDKCVESFFIALELSPDAPYVIGKCLHHLMMLCDWQYLNEGLTICEDVLNKKVTASTPFEVLNFFDNPDLHLLTAQLCKQHKFKPHDSLGTFSKAASDKKIRIGYFSADLYGHPASIWLAEQLENHDKSKVELYAFCLKSVQDPMRDRLEAAFDHWIDVTNLSDLEVTKLSRELGIDIAIDLNGHTADGRPGIFAARAAPIQINHIGFPGSMGAEYIDYIFGQTLGSEENLEDWASTRQFITEKIAYVPSMFTYDRQRQVSDEPLTRAQYGLPEKGFVFTCQNGCQKLMPEVFDIWMDILKAVPGSVLWLLKPNDTAVKNLIKEAKARGVDAERLIFTEREVVSMDQEKARIGRYLASYKLADLFLDTWPYNAGTTAVDALWAGLPVLTKKGKALVARMATEALRGIEVPELITKTPEEYKELAIELAHNPDNLKLLREKIQRNRLTTALFDPVANTRHIENAYLEMYKRYAAGEQPNEFIVQP